MGDFAKYPAHVPLAADFAARYSPLEFSLETDPPGGALPAIAQPAVFPVVSESEATRPEFTCVMVADAAWVMFIAGTNALANSSIAEKEIATPTRGRPITLMTTQLLVSQETYLGMESI